MANLEDNITDWENKIEVYNKTVIEIEKRVDNIIKKKKEFAYLQSQLKMIQGKMFEYKKTYENMSLLHSAISDEVPNLKSGEAVNFGVLHALGKKNKQIKKEKPSIRFIKDDNNIIKDNLNGLEWFVHPQDNDISWDDAAGWVKSLNEDNFCGGNWEMPTIVQLKGIYDNGCGKHNMDSIFGSFNIYKNWLWVWSSEIVDEKGNRNGKFADYPCARCFAFSDGGGSWSSRGDYSNVRIFSVRVR